MKFANDCAKCYFFAQNVAPAQLNKNLRFLPQIANCAKFCELQIGQNFANENPTLDSLWFHDRSTFAVLSIPYT